MPLTYQTAIELQKAGYPQPGSGYIAHTPSLGELVEEVLRLAKKKAISLDEVLALLWMELTKK